ncbi:MAG: nitroreductase family protein, partial [Thermodesulfobacteriota bacterium]
SGYVWEMRIMDAIEAILTRRSIRKYTSDPVTDETITQLLKAAMSAPTAGNEPWHFVVVRDRAVLNAVTTVHPHADMLKQAQVAIAVCGDPTIEVLKGRWILDCAACTENILVAANALGLGACWVGIYPEEKRMLKLRELMEIPDHVVPLCMVSLGWPVEKKEPSARFRKERIHLERW